MQLVQLSTCNEGVFFALPFSTFSLRAFYQAHLKKNNSNFSSCIWLQDFRDIKAFSASTTWVCEIRSSFQEIPTTPNSRKLQRHKNFDQVLHWVSDEFEQSDKVYMTPFKEKYVEVYGSPAKSWERCLDAYADD